MKPAFVERLHRLLPDRRESMTCRRNEVRGNENRIHMHGRWMTLCDDCTALALKTQRRPLTGSKP